MMRSPSAGGGVRRFKLGLDDMAVFARPGAEIPLGPAVRCTGELAGSTRIAERWRGG